ncbi:sensor of ECF-type sigma factor [Polaribacter sp. IC073]|uniref:sensor of ECF-type sigma factor n=1 Tax=Polaribacter sp. IC073 TaxID=2508540 RepID=UPI0011BDCEB7|nr:sensor of ECF-type sigma factor [Polaribacter sp. IC073]TXD48269.1 sensor of ECF-type sigma factor [Polaribacter sp. IC073]
MKKYTIILTLFLTAFQAFGQHSQESRDKIKALKVAFLTQELKLTSMEAEKFWPVYNKHEEEIDLLRTKVRLEFKKKIKEVGDLNNLDESQAKKLVLLKLDLEKKMVAGKIDFNTTVSKFLSYKKIMKLHLSEREFARELMRKYGKGRKAKE